MLYQHRPASLYEKHQSVRVAPVGRLLELATILLSVNTSISIYSAYNFLNWKKSRYIAAQLCLFHLWDAVAVVLYTITISAILNAVN